MAGHSLSLLYSDTTILAQSESLYSLLISLYQVLFFATFNVRCFVQFVRERAAAGGEIDISKAFQDSSLQVPGLLCYRSVTACIDFIATHKAKHSINDLTSTHFAIIVTKRHSSP